jgi:hypothetical protein
MEKQLLFPVTPLISAPSLLAQPLDGPDETTPDQTEKV